MATQNKPQRKMNRYKEAPRYQAPETGSAESYDARTRNYYDHQAANLQSREELKRRGVKSSTPNLPRADYTFDGAAKRMREGKKQRKSDRYLDQVIRSVKGGK